MKLRGGVWYTDFSLSTGERVRRSLNTSDKAKAKAAERALMYQLESGLSSSALAPQSSYDPPPTPQTPQKVATTSHHAGLTIREAFKRAKREYEPWRTSKSPKTIDDNYKHLTDTSEKARGFDEKEPLVLLTRQRVREYVFHLQDAKKSPSTINQRLSLISVLLKLAEDWTEGVITPFKMPRQSSRRGRIRIYSYAEEAKILKSFRENASIVPRDADMADLVVVLIDTGFRLSELLNLPSADIEWEEGLIPAWVTKADLPRRVPMTERVKAILGDRKDLEKPFGMFTKDSADDRWEAMRKRIKVNTVNDPEFVIHALRHTCASRLAANGMDAFRIQKWMGHKTIQTTMIYVTLCGNDLKGLADALDASRKFMNQAVPKGVPEAPKNDYQKPPVEVSV